MYQDLVDKYRGNLEEKRAYNKREFDRKFGILRNYYRLSRPTPAFRPNGRYPDFHIDAGFVGGPSPPSDVFELEAIEAPIFELEAIPPSCKVEPENAPFDADPDNAIIAETHIAKIDSGVIPGPKQGGLMGLVNTVSRWASYLVEAAVDKYIDYIYAE